MTAIAKTDPLGKLGLRDLDDQTVLVLHPQRYHLAVMIASETSPGDFKLDQDYPVPRLPEIKEIIAGKQKFLVPEALVERFHRVHQRGKVFYRQFDRGLPGNHYRLAITDARFRNDYQQAIEGLRSRRKLSIGGIDSDKKKGS